MIMQVKKYLKTFCASIMFVCVASFATPAYAANDALLELMKILKDKGSITQEEYNLLVNAAEAEDRSAEAIKQEVKEEVKKDVEKQVAEATKDVPKITTKGKFKVESSDGDWSFQPIGRIFWDQVWTDDDGSTSEDSGTELRRARLGFQTTFMKVFKSKLEVDFAESSDAVWKDVWISYNNKNSLGKYYIKLGQSHVPFGHATISSSKYMPLMRRPLFGDGPQEARRVGVAFRQDSAAENRWLVHAGVFRPGISSDSDEIGTDDMSEEISTAIRVAGTPIYRDKKHLFHIGGSYQYRNMNGDALSNMDNALLTHIGSGGTMEANFGTNAEKVNAYDIEAIGVWGPFHAVGEFVHWDVDDPDGNADLDAWALDAGWFLTGESMKYKKGQFSGISPKKALGKGGWGAWQVAARIENMDFNDGTVVGGDADVFTAGLNWYPVKNVRFMANWGTVLDFECTVTAANTLTDTCETGAHGKEPHAFSLRAQVYW